MSCLLALSWCEVIVLAECRASNDVVLLLDVSGSLGDIYDFMTTFARTVVFGLDFQEDRNRLAIATFSDDVTIEFGLTQYSASPLSCHPCCS